MVDRRKLDLTFDPARLEADLLNLHDTAWIDHFVTQNYDGEWHVIPLRGPVGASHPVQMIYSDPTCSEFGDTPFLEAMPYIREILTMFQCVLLATRLMKLSPGSTIKEHRDHDLDLESGTVRLHVPIVTNDEVDFRLNGLRVVMQPGECWYLRLSDPHSVENRGKCERIHLVIDAVANPWLRSLIQKEPNA